MLPRLCLQSVGRTVEWPGSSSTSSKDNVNRSAASWSSYIREEADMSGRYRGFPIRAQSRNIRSGVSPLLRGAVAHAAQRDRVAVALEVDRRVGGHPQVGDANLCAGAQVSQLED